MNRGHLTCLVFLWLLISLESASMQRALRPPTTEIEESQENAALRNILQTSPRPKLLEPFFRKYPTLNTNQVAEKETLKGILIRYRTASRIQLKFICLLSNEQLRQYLVQMIAQTPTPMAGTFQSSIVAKDLEPFKHDQPVITHQIWYQDTLRVSCLNRLSDCLLQKKLVEGTKDSRALEKECRALASEILTAYAALER